MLFFLYVSMVVAMRDILQERYLHGVVGKEAVTYNNIGVSPTIQYQRKSYESRIHNTDTDKHNELHA